MSASPDGRIVIDRAPLARGAVLLVHGFTRSPERLQTLADRLVAEGLTVIRPRLGALSPRTAMSRASALGVAVDAIRRIGLDPALRWVVIGHSAGAAAGTWMAAELIGAGVDMRGLVYADGVESPTRLIEGAWSQVAHLPVFDVCAEPSRCNRQGGLADWLRPRREGVFGVLVPGGGHGDVEGRELAVYRWACGDRSPESTREMVLDVVVASALGMLGLQSITPAGGRIGESSWGALGLRPLTGTRVP
jgi:pimeloyl-ACP methyl ester carboxylesterase